MEPDANKKAIISLIITVSLVANVH